MFWDGNIQNRTAVPATLNEVHVLEKSGYNSAAQIAEGVHACGTVSVTVSCGAECFVFHVFAVFYAVRPQ